MNTKNNSEINNDSKNSENNNNSKNSENNNYKKKHQYAVELYENFKNFCSDKPSVKQINALLLVKDQSDKDVELNLKFNAATRFLFRGREEDNK